MRVNYYFINEDAARRAHDANSFREFHEGAATASYRSMVDRAAEIADKQKARVSEEYHARIDELLDKYSRKLAENINKGNEIDARVPSIMVAGGSNFPVRKKEKQNEARRKNAEEYEYIQGLLNKIESVGMGGIRSDDENAVSKLEKKLTATEARHQMMKVVNAHFRKHGTLDGCPGLTTEQIAQIQSEMNASWHMSDAPFPAWELQNSNANIRRMRERIEALKKEAERAKDVADPIIGDGFELIENHDICRIQFLFDGKPDEETRSILKSNGFRWAPSEKAWQRMLNDNGRRAAKYVMDAIKK